MVLLPEPLSPTIPNTSPGYNSKSICAQATIEPESGQILESNKGPVLSIDVWVGLPYILVKPSTFNNQFSLLCFITQFI